MALLSKSQSAGIRVRVCMAYVGGLAPRKGGGVASATSGIVKHTAGEVDYLLLTVYDQAEQEDLQELYPSSVQTEYVRPCGNFLANVMHYLVRVQMALTYCIFMIFFFLGEISLWQLKRTSRKRT